MSAPDYIGRYRIVRPLGEGGMGRVLLAEVAGSGGFARRVVLKLVRDELDETLKQSLLEEARLQATLVHRNIVPVLDLHESGAERLVVLEHIDGMDLRQLLTRVPLLDWPLAAFVAGEVAAALDYAHRRQIIHRDVSPANILVSVEGEVKLTDFGVAKLIGGGKGRAVGPTQGLKGKLGYMAPEQMKAQPVDGRADVYALGVVMYEMLTGKNPMRDRGPIVPPPLPSTVPRELAAIVMRAVERNRDDRFASAADLREAIVHVPGQPKDPGRLLADFIGELHHKPEMDDALVAAVLGGKQATRVAGKRDSQSRRPWWIVAAMLLVAGLATGAIAVQRRHKRAAAIAAAKAATGPTPGTPAPAKTIVVTAPPVVIEPTPTTEPSEEEETAPAKAPHHVVRKKAPPKPQKGTLSVNAIPWAKLFVDGKAAGHTPRLNVPLDAGKHSLKLVTQAGETRSKTVEIAPNKETKLTVVFSEP